MKRNEIQEKAKQCVTGDRDHDYGGPEKSFDCIAQMWTAYVSYAYGEVIQFQPADVAAMMSMLKLARIAKSPEKADSWIDLAGYAACGGECATQGQAVKPGTDPEYIIAEADRKLDDLCDRTSCDKCEAYDECDVFIKSRTLENAIKVLKRIEELNPSEDVNG